MRRLPAIVFVCAAVALLGAARPTPTPSPTPAPTAAPQQALPLVVVFPFDISSDLKAGTGTSAAQVFAQQMNNDGGIDAITGPTSVKRADYAKYAASVSALYYVAGYMTPLGNGVSLVEQVVATRSGTIVFGQTAQIESIEDASAQAAYIHDGILAREKQLADAYTQAQAQATPTPEGGHQADLGKGLAGIRGLFKHKAGATPAPAVVKPSKGVLVAHVDGSLPASDLTKATSALYSALSERYNAKLTPASGSNLAKTADALCGTDRNNTIATGTASATLQHRTFGSHAQYTFVLQVYTCFGAKLAEGSGTADSLAAAVQKAVAAYASAHPQNV